MPHPFHDKLFFFIGRPERCSRQAIRDALIAAGGVSDDNLTTFTDIVIAMKGAESTKAYKNALQSERSGFLVILSEEQFFEILDGKADLPEKEENNRGNRVITSPARNQAIYDELDQVKKEVVEEKRINSLAKHGIPTPEGRLKIDIRSLYKAHRIAEFLKEKYGTGTGERCELCGKPAAVFINGEPGIDLKLCVDCNNRKIAEMTGFILPSDMPKHISMMDSDGKTHVFEVTFLMYPVGMTLIAFEDGATRYRADVFGALDTDIDELWQSLILQLAGFLSEKYMDKDGYIAGSKAVGYIEYNRERGVHEVVIDGKPYTWQDLEKNISAHEGFRIKIEFGDYGDVL